MKKRGLVTRIIAIILCAIMILSVMTVLIYSRALGPDVPQTGSSNKTVIFFIALALGIAVAAATIISSKKSKSASSQDSNEEKDN